MLDEILEFFDSCKRRPEADSQRTAKGPLRPFTGDDDDWEEQDRFQRDGERHTAPASRANRSAPVGDWD